MTEGVNGVVSAHHLRELTDELDERNAAWENQINQYFEENFKCPINVEGCKENCGNYGCGN